MQVIVIFLSVAILLSGIYVFGFLQKATQAPSEEETVSPATTNQTAAPSQTYYKSSAGAQTGTPPISAGSATSSGQTVPVNSPYFGKIKFSSASHTTIRISSQFRTDEKISISGWKIKGNNGEITIPQGMELFLFETSAKANIYLSQSDQLHLLSAKVPLGMSLAFRPNKCFGYLRDVYKNLPYAPSKICPAIDRDEICYFSTDCQSAILSLRSCQPINYSTLSLSFDSNCQSYIENYISRNLSYNGCVENYYKDKDFYQKIWYIYVGYDIFCKCSDTLYLYDQQGLLVDQYSYKGY